MSDQLITSIRQSLSQYHDAQRANHAVRFFKTGPGEYGEGDQFLGITVPQIRKVLAEYRHVPLEVVQELLYSVWHEERLWALLFLVKQFSRARKEEEQTAIYDFYMQHKNQVNNWDLVDSSAHKIVGPYLEGRSHDVLEQLATSANMWHRRIAVIATFHFIKKGNFVTTLKLAEGLLEDPEDLMHKAVGWMLREIGKQDKRILLDFLNQYSPFMPRIMLSYAMEKLTPELRQWYRSQKRGMIRVDNVHAVRDQL